MAYSDTSKPTWHASSAPAPPATPDSPSTTSETANDHDGVLVVAAQRSGDQPGGLLVRVQSVQGPHSAWGHAGQQRLQGGVLAAFVGDLPLSEDDAGGVVDRGDQERAPRCGDRAVQEFPVSRRGR